MKVLATSSTCVHVGVKFISSNDGIASSVCMLSSSEFSNSFVSIAVFNSNNDGIGWDGGGSLFSGVGACCTSNSSKGVMDR